MNEDAIKAFAHRLNQAVEQHPQVPVSPYGRQSWLVQKLAKEAGLKVSNNTVNKWMRGMAKPRDENVVKLAKVLDVDDVWLGHGRMTNLSTPKEELVASASNAGGALLILAGLVEAGGHKVMLEDDGTPSLRASIKGEKVNCVAASGQADGKTISFIVPEPVGPKRIIGVIVGVGAGGPTYATAHIELVDLTDVPREKLGGVSVVKIERRKEGKFKVEGHRNLHEVLRAPEAIGHEK